MTIREEAQKQLDELHRNKLLQQAKWLLANQKKHVQAIAEIDELFKEIEAGRLVNSFHASEPNR